MLSTFNRGSGRKLIACLISLLILGQGAAYAAYTPPDNGGPDTSQATGTR